MAEYAIINLLHHTKLRHAVCYYVTVIYCAFFIYSS